MGIARRIDLNLRILPELLVSRRKARPVVQSSTKSAPQDSVAAAVTIVGLVQTFAEQQTGVSPAGANAVSS